MRGGESLINAKHATEEKCLGENQACSKSTTGIKTMCMAPWNLKLCPITDI